MKCSPGSADSGLLQAAVSAEAGPNAGSHREVGAALLELLAGLGGLQVPSCAPGHAASCGTAAAGASKGMCSVGCPCSHLWWLESLSELLSKAEGRADTAAF